MSLIAKYNSLLVVLVLLLPHDYVIPRLQLWMLQTCCLDFRSRLLDIMPEGQEECFGLVYTRYHALYNVCS